MSRHKHTKKIHSYASSALEPDQIRSIRKRLGLTQTEAGPLLGVGPRAFSKYEAGTIAPSASLVVLLRLLDDNPELLGTGVVPSSPSPFEITAADVANLASPDLPGLLRRFLHAETHNYGLSGDGIHVPDNTSAPDGGEDGRIRWEGGPDRTRFLPARFCQFQLKARKIGPAAAGREVLSSGQLRPMIGEALREGGAYILMSSHQYTQMLLQPREEAIRNAIRSSGLLIRDDQVRFRDGNQIADWANAHPAVAVWVLERTRGGASTFGTWTNWRDRFEHARSPWVADDRLPRIVQGCAPLRKPQTVTRFVGLPGIGKSRLLLEALGPDNLNLRDLVLYAAQPETHPASITELVRRLSMSGRRALLVVDRCSPETHTALSGRVRHRTSQLSLISIDDEVPDPLGPEEELIREASRGVTDGILKTITPRPHFLDEYRLTRFPKGFPQLAVMAVASWKEHRDLPVTDEEMVNRLVLGRETTNKNHRLHSAALLAIFGRIGMDSTVSKQRREVAELGQGLSERNLYSSVARLEARRIAHRKGRYATMELLPLVKRLAERHWIQEWTPDDWDRVFAGNISPHLKIAAATNLALLSETPIASKVVSHVLRPNGPFTRTQRKLTRDFVEILEEFAAIDTRQAIDCLAPVVYSIEDFESITGDIRRSLVNTAQRIASSENTFSEGAELLFRLSVAENESYSNNATGIFSALFCGPFALTSASGEARLRFLQDVNLDTPTRRKLVVGALQSGLSAASWDTTSDREILLERQQPWSPVRREEVAAYVQACADMLTNLALEDGTAGVAARSALAEELRSLVRHGLMDSVEKAVRAVLGKFGMWTDATDSLGFFLETEVDKTPEAVAVRVRALMTELQPDRLDLQVRQIVTEMPHYYPFEEGLEIEDRFERQLQEVRKLASELAQRPRLLYELIPKLCRGTHRHTYAFGEALPAFVSSRSDLLDAILAALRRVPTDEQNSDLLAGYLRGAREEDSALVREGKQRVVECEHLWGHYCRVCSAVGLESPDVDVLLSVLSSDGFPVSSVDRWSMERLDRLERSTIGRLFSALMEHSREAYWIGIRMLRSYMKQAGPERVVPDALLRTLLSRYVLWGRRGRADDGADGYHLDRIVAPLLDCGRDDDMARAAALALVTELVQEERSDKRSRRSIWSIRNRHYRSLFRTVLADFPDIAWPLIGGVIVTDNAARLRMESVLGSSFRIFDKEEALISALPEETIISWCRAHPATAPAFAGKAVPILDDRGCGKVKQALHPIMRRMLDEFGTREDVREAVISNLHCYTIHTERSKYFGAHIPVFRSLEAHSERDVRQWAGRVVRDLERTVEKSMERQEERDMEWNT